MLAWGLKPAFVTGDSWYNCTTNFKVIKNHQTGFVFAVETNRTVSLVKGRWQQVQDLDIPDNGLEVFLKDFGKVTLFRAMLKNQRRHYVVYLPEEVPFERNDFSKIHDQHWQIEQYHRAIRNGPKKIGQRDKCLLGSSRHLGSRFVVDAVRRAPVKRLVPSLGIVEGEIPAQ